MPRKRLDQASYAENSPKKLISAVHSIWQEEGASGISARALTGAAGLPLSSIYYHFGDIEQLLEGAQTEARAMTTRLCDQHLDALRGTVRGPAALGQLLAAIIDDWCEKERGLAFAWREGQLMALRDPRHVPSAAKWDELWLGFWEEVCNRLDLADMAQATAWVFGGASGLHLLRWRRLVDRSALTELCMGWGNWLDGHLAGAAPWFNLAQQDAATLIAPPASDDPVADAVAQAAAETVAQYGVAGLTHRAVAAEAGTTLGVVSYKFRTSTDLLNAAFETIYRRMVPHTPSEMAVATLDRTEALVQLHAGFPDRAHVLASDELLVASARDNMFQSFAAQLRYLRGRTSGRYFQALMGFERPISAVDAAIFSAFSSGRVRAYLVGGRPWMANAPTGDFAPLLTRLDQR